ncbi:type I-E CRISPR-associated protein Cse1/CasA [Ligilactobacillus agilis]|uniref:Type I-E CRISPR-associated protein Cse1/CasA n=1 Tax=Ligilactobacillus agilis TaxID=1601 RepID=A0A9Q9JAS3_9LACO|nr:type I-E CRISPR-associated protein Cse1/CasA [Ligilactobacillus agilis]UXC64418.1 type I-E CRISPR-associated protein Cse1/CasA [Ligilactobacillus agilis]UXC66420.1 type I-E CRISPR-associated protein Cse1/CasA [Ligilactobacillus agilis]
MKVVVKLDFNLVTNPWIKVVDSRSNKEKLVSMADLFKNAQNYRDSAGEMHVQDLAILRAPLLAILTTVFSRFDAEGEAYDWLNVDEETWTASLADDEVDIDDVQEVLLETWENIYQDGKFPDKVVEYLDKYKDGFNLFGENAFYQVSSDVYDRMVPAKNKLSTGTGKVAVRQINRLISESGNSPAIFSPKSSLGKDEITLPEFVRWLITYQNFAEVGGNVPKIKKAGSGDSGWLYNIDPVIVKGKNLFETLMFNLVLSPEDKKEILQHPYWEADKITYFSNRANNTPPNNIAELYTNVAKMMHIDWKDGKPTIYVAKLTKPDTTNAFIEPMTTWDYNSKKASYYPKVKQKKHLSERMWRNFGFYIKSSNDGDHEPGIVRWIDKLKEEDILPEDMLVNLETINFVKADTKNQAPYFEVYDNMSINAGVLFDRNQATFWPKRIEDTVTMTKDVGDAFEDFASKLGNLRGLRDAREFEKKLSAEFYDQLNKPFNDWLASLRAGQEPDNEITRWKNTLKKEVTKAGNRVLQSASPRDIIGRKESKEVTNIFTLYNQMQNNVRKHLE